MIIINNYIIVITTTTTPTTTSIAKGYVIIKYKIYVYIYKYIICKYIIIINN